MCRSIRVYYSALIATLFVLSANLHAAQAWEADVHFGLTKWLALKAGFSQAESEVVAKANLNVDNDWFTMPISTTIIAACLGGLIGPSDGGAISVHDNHFPSELDPPEDPQNRLVKPGHAYQSQNERMPPHIRSNSFLKRLGAYLHALQDTWSHQGQPDIPYPCDPQYGWGHAIARGGWCCHLADITAPWARKNRDVLPMAEMTYRVLAANYLLAPPWETLVGSVKEFALTDSKVAKDKWFAEQGFKNSTYFMQQTSLPDCLGSDCAKYEYWWPYQIWRDITANHVQLQAIPPYILSFVQSFLQALTGNGGVAAFLPLAYIDIETVAATGALGRAMNVEKPCPKLFDLLLPWMLGKHFVEGRGAETPVILCEKAVELNEAGKGPLPCEEAMALVSQMVAQAPRHAPAQEDKNIPYVMAAVTAPAPPGVRPDKYLAFARFIHLPDRVLVLVADERPRITDVFWMPLR